MLTVMDEVVATGQVRGGRLTLHNPRAFKQAVARLDDRWQLVITVQRLRATRSPKANAYYWGVVIKCLSEQTGYHADELHDLMKMLHLPKSLAVCDGNGEVTGEYVMGGSTRKLTIEEFYTYVERVRQWAAETLDLAIPDPDPGWFMKATA